MSLRAAAGEIQTPPRTLEGVLRQARQDFDELPLDDAFIELCDRRSIPAGATPDFHYWSAVADYGYGKSAELRRQGVAEKDIVFGELFTATPDFLHKQAFLDKHAHDYHNPAVHDAKVTASYYNGLVRQAAEQWPGLRPSELQQQLLGIAGASLTKDHIKQAAPYYLSSAIRGAQHELAFGQILEHTGREFRESSLQEDLHGIDYVIRSHDGRQTDYVDVKASMHDIIKHRRHHQPYSRTHDGHLLMSSLVTDREFDDSFHISDELAARQAGYLDRMLRDTERH